MKMPNEFKVRVNNEESKKLQEVLFENGFYWSGHIKEVRHLDCNYIYIRNKRLFLLGNEHHFNKSIYKELTVEQILSYYHKAEDSCDDNLSASKNNGGKTDYYQLENAPFKINDFDDFAEWRGLNGNQFNMGKVMWAFNVGRHNGTDYERELNKVIHYANREKLRISRELKDKE